MNKEIKELQNLYSWAEFYKINNNTKSYEITQKK